MSRLVLVLGVWSLLLSSAAGQAKPKPIRDLIKQLRSAKEHVRWVAVDLIAKRGAKGKAAHAELTRLLKDPSIQVRYRAGVALLKTGARAKLVMPLIKDADLIDCELLAILIRRGMDHKEVVTLLVNEYFHSSLNQLDFEKIFGWLGPKSIAIATPLLKKELSGKEVGNRTKALAALRSVRTVPASLLNPLVKLSQSTDDPAEVVRGVVEVLGEVGKPAEPHLRRLMKASRDSIRLEVRYALGKIAPQDRMVQEELAVCIETEVGRRSKTAQYYLDRVKNWAVDGRLNWIQKTEQEPVRQTAKELQKLLDSDIELICLDACESLFRLQPNHPGIGPALVKVLKFHDEDTIKQACRLIVKMKLKAVVTAPQLTRLLTIEKFAGKTLHPHNLHLLRASIAGALQSLGPVGVKALLPLLKHKDSRLRSLATMRLGGMGAVAKSAVPDLIACLEDRAVRSIAISNHLSIGRQIRCLAAQSLGLIGPAAQPAIPKLIKMLKVKEGSASIYAVNALGNIGCSPDVVIPHLLKMPTDHSYTAIQIVNAIHKLAPEHKCIVPRIRILLKEIGERATPRNSYFLRMRDVADLILRLGKRGRFLTPELIQLAVRSEFMGPEVRFEAALTLSQISSRKSTWLSRAWRIARRHDVVGLFWDRYLEISKRSRHGSK